MAYLRTGGMGVVGKEFASKYTLTLHILRYMGRIGQDISTDPALRFLLECLAVT